MNVEVGIDNVYYPVSVKSVTEGGELSVCYKNDWRAAETVNQSQCRIVKNESHSDIKVGDVIEAFTGVSEGVSGWQKRKVSQIKGDFIRVDTIDGPKKSDVLEPELCRSKATTYATIFPKNFKTYTMMVPDDLEDYFQGPDGIKDLAENLPDTHVEFDTVKKDLVFSSFSAKAIKRAEMLIDMYYKDTRTKIALQHRTSEIQKMIEGNSLQVSANHLEEFTVDKEFIRLVIGSQGATINSARRLSGIVDIELIEDHNPVVIKIYADDEESAQEARALLEYTTGVTHVARSMVGKVVGKNGHAIQEVVDKSGVMRVQIANGDSHDNDVDPVPFIFTGLRDSVENAIFLLEYNVKHMKDVQDMRDDVEEMNRKLNYHRNTSPVNGYSEGEFRNGSRGGFRGGRGNRGGRGGRGGFSPRDRDGFSNQQNGRQNEDSQNSRGRRGRGRGRRGSFDENGHS